MAITRREFNSLPQIATEWLHQLDVVWLEHNRTRSPGQDKGKGHRTNIRVLLTG